MFAVNLEMRYTHTRIRDFLMLHIMIKLRRNDEALLAAALTGFAWSCFGLVEVRMTTKRNLIIMWDSRTVLLVSRTRIPQCKNGNLS